MSRTFFDLMKSDKGFNYRWIQPPQVVYLVSTIDSFGNNNATPVTLGTCVGVNSLADASESNYYFAFSVGSKDVPNIPVRQAFANLNETKECVISFPGAELMDQIWVAGLPLPRGINEIEVSRLTALSSQKIKPSGIKECPVNIEAIVKTSCAVGDHYTLFVCQAVGISVSGEMLQKDMENPLAFGILNFDPVFETAIATAGHSAPRLYFGQIDRQNLVRNPDDIGSSTKWLGTFEEWIEDEWSRGKISEVERRRILELNETWQQNPDPELNSNVKAKLTQILSKMIWNKRV